MEIQIPFIALHSPPPQIRRGRKGRVRRSTLKKSTFHRWNEQDNLKLLFLIVLQSDHQSLYYLINLLYTRKST